MSGEAEVHKNMLSMYYSWASFQVVKTHNNNLYVNGLLAMVLNTETTTDPFLFGGKMCTC
jgi:hypothetical protein